MPSSKSATNNQIQESPIVFYDGECCFCSWSVQTIHKLDHSEEIHFAPLQGNTAKRLLPEADRLELSTLIYLQPNLAAEKRSTAVIEILRQTGGFLGFIAPIGYFLPRSWRDSMYDFVAKRRKQILSAEACELPSPSLRAKMLP